MTTFAEQLTTLTDAELDKLERILLMLQNNVFDGDFDELLQKMRIQSVILSPTDADLIGSRIYELEIFQNLHPADARKLALEDFNAGKLHPKPKSIPRYKGSQSKPANTLAGVGSASTHALAVSPTAPLAEPTTTATATTIQPLPDNVIPLRPDRYYSKFFNSPLGDNSVW
jgi:hypothetical protein